MFMPRLLPLVLALVAALTLACSGGDPEPLAGTERSLAARDEATEVVETAPTVTLGATEIATPNQQQAEAPTDAKAKEEAAPTRQAGNGCRQRTDSDSDRANTGGVCDRILPVGTGRARTAGRGGIARRGSG